MRLVDPESAKNGRSWEATSNDVRSIDRNRQDIVKFAIGSAEYDVVLHAYQDLENKAPGLLYGRYYDRNDLIDAAHAGETDRVR